MLSENLRAKFPYLVCAWASRSPIIWFATLSETNHIARQCIIDLYGGDVSFAGEILHGKTSPLRHDTKGIYANIAQDLPVTRYHSLAGTHPTIPACLEVSSWIANGEDGGKGIIMGVRHKEYVIEAVQYHPESILTAEGRCLIKNFLNMRGGTWEEDSRAQLATKLEKTSETRTNQPEDILSKIFQHRRAAVALQKTVPSQRPMDLQSSLELGLAPPLISFVDRLRLSPFRLSLMAEIKRASPSKGIISLSACAPSLARIYALAGASVISVLTEPQWFKGSIDDLRAVRQAVDGMPNRPAILRKEFILDEYQILEARLAGADTVLLIVKMLDNETLRRLYQYSQSLGMEPLVEVNTAEEMTIALNLGSKVIGVNNRNLRSFDVDLGTTNRLLAHAPKDTIICALSGITGNQDVQLYQQSGVGAVLVGEALMRAQNTSAFIHQLLGNSHVSSTPTSERLLVKICGTRTEDAALAAVRNGADFIGIILVPGTPRYVREEEAMAISRVVHQSSESTSPAGTTCNDHQAIDFFANAVPLLTAHRPRLVGVFRNQPLSEILKLQKAYELDVVQLHGNEPLEWARQIPVPVIKSFKPGQPELNRRGYFTLPLLDSGAGGTGELLDMSEVRQALAEDSELRVLLAGGLTPENIVEAIKTAGDFGDRIVGVDVSSGLEVDGVQDIGKIESFIREARSVR